MSLRSLQIHHENLGCDGGNWTKSIFQTWKRLFFTFSVLFRVARQKPGLPLPYSCSDKDAQRSGGRNLLQESASSQFGAGEPACVAVVLSKQRSRRGWWFWASRGTVLPVQSHTPGTRRPVLLVGLKALTATLVPAFLQGVGAVFSPPSSA